MKIVTICCLIVKDRYVPYTNFVQGRGLIIFLLLVRRTDYDPVKFTSMCQSTIQMSDSVEFIHHSYIHIIFGLWK